MAVSLNEPRDANLRLLIPKSSLLSKIQVAKFHALNGSTHQEDVCPPCEVTLRLKTTSEYDLREWLHQFSEHTRSDYIVNWK